MCITATNTNRFLTFFAFLLFINCLKAQQATDSLALRFSKYINKEDLSAHLNILASDDYEGRETGKEGQKKAAKYIADYFRSIGVQPIPETDTYYQEFHLLEQNPEGTMQIGSKSFVFLEHFFYFPGFADTVLKAKSLLFLGYGIEDKNYSDYQNANVKNRILIILDGEPHDKKGKSIVTKNKKNSIWSDDVKLKITTAKKNGAAAVLLIRRDYNEQVAYLKHFIEQPTMVLEQETQTKDFQRERKRLHAFFISPAMVKEFISEEELAQIEKTIGKTKKPIQKEIATDLTIRVDRDSKHLTSENVLGYIEGTDLKNELIVITAHYDHIGKHDGEVYNGADDDGSGTVALLEIAQAFQTAIKNNYRPRRSILIMPVSGEEKGLLGSFYYSENPVFPLENTVANLNIDMIGRMDSLHEGNPDYVYLIGSDILSKDLHNISEKANELYTKIKLDYTYNNLTDPNRYYYRSDHYNFAKKNIPVIFYFNGVHKDYHKPTDEVSKIDFAKIEKITRLVFFTAWELANRENRPALNKN